MFTLSIQADDEFPDDVVNLHGTVTVWPGEHEDTPLAEFAVIPFVWRFAQAKYGSGSDDHGWRPAGTRLLYEIRRVDKQSGAWRLDGATPGLQYAALLVGRADVRQKYFTKEAPATVHTAHNGPGTLPRQHVLGAPAFTRRSQRVHIETTPDDHLTGAVLGVGRAAWDDPWLASHMRIASHDRFRMMAWAETNAGAAFIGDTRCHESGYWTFGEVDSRHRGADFYHVAVVEEGFDASPDIPRVGDGVVSIHSRPRNVLMRQGAVIPFSLRPPEDRSEPH